MRRVRVPAALNGFGLWLGLMVGLTIVNYGFPIAQLLATRPPRCRPSSSEHSDEPGAATTRSARGAIAVTAGLAVVAAATGFVLLPQLEGKARLQGVWDAICSAAGLVQQERPEPALVRPRARPRRWWSLRR